MAPEDKSALENDQAASLEARVGKAESLNQGAQLESKKRSQYDRNKRRAMTRMIDRVSDDFVSTFSETGVDSGPEKDKKEAQKSPSEALKKREEREQQESEREAAQEREGTALKGFGALLSKRRSTQELKTGSLFSRLLADDEAGMAIAKQGNGLADLLAQPESKVQDLTKHEQNQPSNQEENEEAVIKIRGTSGKRRGLYTACLKKPVLAVEIPEPTPEPIKEDSRNNQIGAAYETLNKEIENREIQNRETQTSDNRPTKALDGSFVTPQIANPPAPPVRSSAMSAREFEVPQVDQTTQRDFSTLRKLANDGTSQAEKARRAAAADAAYESQNRPQAKAQAPEKTTKRNLFRQIFGYFKRLFGK
ncbi:MAG: hypothetical protein J0M35_16265 [Candidatus Obscuribacter phosphatis]|uniref:Uncharacterized protein n=1 Tax=Candidatus Obscuribacter phosphatis TaxID=1906157 RepID=A0A8J7PK66_9BACT|nr:hypothetical protein [Candidatus Obscuribacter phosphatis]